MKLLFTFSVVLYFAACELASCFTSVKRFERLLGGFWCYINTIQYVMLVGH